MNSRFENVAASKAPIQIGLWHVVYICGVLLGLKLLVWSNAALRLFLDDNRILIVLDEASFVLRLSIIPPLIAELLAYPFSSQRVFWFRYLWVRCGWIVIGNAARHYFSVAFSLYESTSPTVITTEEVFMMVMAALQCLAIFIIMGGYLLWCQRSKRRNDALRQAGPANFD